MVATGFWLKATLASAAIALSAPTVPASAQQSSPMAKATAPAPRDGQHDFDWEFGNWATHVRVLRNPLSGAAPDWAEFNGTSIVKPVLGGRSNSVELSVKGEKGAIEGVSLRLYNPQSRQWSLNYATIRGGAMTAPLFGGFDAKGRGRFFGQDTLDGRTIWVRFDINPISAREARFEQYYSADGGQSWELNWVAVDTRQSAAPTR
jgi:hypothetical protein